MFTTSAWPPGARTPAAGAPDQWREIADALGVCTERLVHVRQVHGTSVWNATTVADAVQREADIIVAAEPDLAVAIQVADCAPILIADRSRGVVSAVHAGWRGMAARAPQVAVAALTREFGSQPSDVVVALGPSVGACCYEVGPEVRDAFAASGFPEAALMRWFHDEPVSIAGNPPMLALAARAVRPDRWFFDGWSAAREQIVEAGVPPAQVFMAGLCSASHPDVFCSFRRDGAPSGRMVGAIRCERRRP